MRETRSPWHPRGFTLIEVMMVIVVIGVMAGIIAPRISGNSQREFQQEAVRLRQMMENATDEAQYAGVELGWQYDTEAGNYRFYRFDDNQLDWTAYAAEGFRDYKLDSRYHLQLELLGKPVDMAELYRKVYKLDEKVRKFGERPVVPSLLFFSAGDYTPFRLWLASDADKEHGYVIEGDGVSRIRLHRREASRMPSFHKD